MEAPQEPATAEDGRSLLGHGPKPSQRTAPHIVGVAGIGLFYIVGFAIWVVQRPRAGEPPIHTVQDWDINQSVSVGRCAVGAIRNTIQVGSIWERTATGILRNISVARNSEDEEELQVHFEYDMVGCQDNATSAHLGQALRQERNFCRLRKDSRFHLQGWTRALDDGAESAGAVRASIVLSIGHRAKGQGAAEHLLDTLLKRGTSGCRRSCALEAETLYRNASMAPVSVVVDKQGHVLIADSKEYCIRRWKVDTGHGDCIFGGRGVGSGTDQLNTPQAMVLDKRGRVLIADAGNHRILRVQIGSAHGQVVFGGRGPGSDLDQLNSPTGLTLDEQGRVLVADMGNHRILQVTLGSTRAKLVFGGRGPGSGLDQLSRPQGIALDGRGNLLVADYGGDRILRMRLGASRGKIIYGGRGSVGKLNRLESPIGLVLDKQGRLLIASLNTKRIVRTRRGFAQGEVVYFGKGPIGYMALDQRGRILFGDSENLKNGRILRLDPDDACMAFDWDPLLRDVGGQLLHRTAGQRQWFSPPSPLWVSYEYWQKLKVAAVQPPTDERGRKVSWTDKSLKLPSTESHAWARKKLFVPVLALVLGLSMLVQASGRRLGLGLAVIAGGALLVVSSAALELAAEATSPPTEVDEMLNGIKNAFSVNGWQWILRKVVAAACTILLPWATVPIYIGAFGDLAPVSCAAGMLWEAHVHTLLGAVVASFAWALLLSERMEVVAEKGVEVSVPDFVTRRVPALKGPWKSSRPELKRAVLFTLYLLVTNDWYNDSCFLLIGNHCGFRGTAVSIQVLAVAVALQLVGSAVLSCRALQERPWRGAAALLLPPAWLELLDEDLAGVSDAAAVVRCLTEDMTQGALQLWYVASITSNLQILYSLATSLPPALLEAASALKRIRSRGVAPEA